MRDVTWWALPGLIVVGPLALLLHGRQIDPPWTVWLFAAPVIGFLLHQTVRWRFEAVGDGFRNPRRAALAAIIERAGLAGRASAGDTAYQAYELVFYAQRDWGAIRDHLHRCWNYVFWFRTVALASAGGAAISGLVLVFGAGRLIAVGYLLALAPFTAILWQKAEQTHAALELLDRGLVLTHWPLYAAAVRALSEPEPHASADPSH